MADVLSQSEVESLLTAVDNNATSAAAVGPPRTATRTQSTFTGQISVYDFKRPERVSKEQMRAFQALHEGFSREFGASLSGMLRSIVEVKLISVDQLTYSEFVFSLENPTCFNLLESKGLGGHIILDLNPSIIYPFIDRLMGGGKTGSNNYPTRPLTEIELKLVSRITKIAISSLQNSWQNICSLDLSVAQIESNPQLVQIVPPNEVIVLISFEITLGDMRGIMNLCIPFNTIEPLAGKLSSDTWATYSKKEVDPAQLKLLEGNLNASQVELIAQLATSKIKASDLVALEVGDVILTERDIHDGATVMVEGRPVFNCDMGIIKGKKALQIRDVLEKVTGKIGAEETQPPPPETAAQA